MARGRGPITKNRYKNLMTHTFPYILAFAEGAQTPCPPTRRLLSLVRLQHIWNLYSACIALKLMSNKPLCVNFLSIANLYLSESTGSCPPQLQYIGIKRQLIGRQSTLSTKFRSMRDYFCVLSEYYPFCTFTFLLVGEMVRR